MHIYCANIVKGNTYNIMYYVYASTVGLKSVAHV